MTPEPRAPDIASLLRLVASYACTRMRSASILAARMQWQAFLAAAPSYPAAAFRGRGIAILSGALPHIISTWVNIKLLRRTGA